jgi:hypothetical protein
MTGKFNRRRFNYMLVGLSIAVFLATSVLTVDGRPYYNLYPYNDPQAAFGHAGIAGAYQNLYNSEYYNPYSYNSDPQVVLDLMDIARANQKLYNYDSSDWEYWANIYLSAPYY